ncbi:MAG: DUF362 domain-containing protein [Desulfobacteraceae bacterium]|nr:DUF362 domain-containing protein [Desulfobacteraceae bacterium]
MTSRVYLMDFRATYKDSGVKKLQRLIDTAGLGSCIRDRDLVALKLHFGELGNTAFIRPVYIRHVVNSVKEAGGVPFLTDANTLYAGSRGDAVHHLATAVSNGFAYPVVEAPLIIADGLRGNTETAVEINQKQFKEVYIGTEIVNSDAMLSVAHFKGHELSGFGGAIKNIGMGCASRRGKMQQHSGIAPGVKKKKCIGCGDCAEHCASGAIDMVDEVAQIDQEKCIGCGECILVCEQEAIQTKFAQFGEDFLERMVEYTLGVLKTKKEKTLCINFINHVSPACDCVPYNDAPIVRDIGIVASTDPVAIDQASVDLVNNEPALPGSCLSAHTDAGADKFRGVYPKVDWTHQLVYAEQLGLGTREYELIKI